MNEARLLEMIDHQNVVRYVKTFEGTLGDRVYLVMELVEGADLLEVVESYTEKGRTFEEEKLWSIMVQLCTALSYLHKELSVVHRDLKPANIRLDHDDRLHRRHVTHVLQQLLNFLHFIAENQRQLS